MNLKNPEIVNLLWAIKPNPPIQDFADGRSDLFRVERRALQLTNGELLLLKVIDHGKIVHIEAFTDRDQWNRAARPYLDKADKQIADEHERNYQEGLRLMGRGERVEPTKKTAIGTFEVVAVTDGKTLKNFKKWSPVEVYVDLPCGEPLVIDRQGIEERIRDVQALMRPDEWGIKSRSSWDLDCQRCKERHRVELQVLVQKGGDKDG